MLEIVVLLMTGTAGEESSSGEEAKGKVERRVDEGELINPGGGILAIFPGYPWESCL